MLPIVVVCVPAGTWRKHRMVEGLLYPCMSRSRAVAEQWTMNRTRLRWKHGMRDPLTSPSAWLMGRHSSQPVLICGNHRRETLGPHYWWDVERICRNPRKMRQNNQGWGVGELRYSSTLPLTHCIGGWVGPRAGLDCMITDTDQLFHIWVSVHHKSIIYNNKPTRCNSGSIVFINNYKYALHVSDALCVYHQEHYKL